MKGFELFPVNDYYKDCILDAVTIKKTNSSWSAILLMRKPNSEKKEIRFYKWAYRNNSWKRTQNFVIKNKDTLSKIIYELNEFKSFLQ